MKTTIDIHLLHTPRRKESISLPKDSTVLDLSRRDLLAIDLPEDGKFPDLQELNLSFNRLESVNLGDFLDTTNTSKLKHLDISHNHIHALSLEPLQKASNLERMNLGYNQLEEIDLSPIRKCSSLAYLDISHNWLREIDTQHLRDKPALKELILTENPLSSIDLSFLQTSLDIEVLSIDWTKIDHLDLSHLSMCKNLRVLGISQNQIRILDLYPLASCTQLEQVNISGIETNSLDIWPLFCCPKLREVVISPRIQIESFPLSPMIWPSGLERIRNRIDHVGMELKWSAMSFDDIRDEFLKLWDRLTELGRFHLRSAFIHLMKLDAFMGFDGDIISVLDSIPPEFGFDQAREILRIRISEGLIEQVKRGGSTHNIDLDLAGMFPAIALLTPIVIEARKKELECITISKRGDTYDMSPLWFTVYGSYVLRALGIGISTGEDGFQRVLTELKQTGIQSIRVEGDCESDSSMHLSSELKAYLLSLAHQLEKL